MVDLASELFTVNWFWKSVNTWRSYECTKGRGLLFNDHPAVVCRMSLSTVTVSIQWLWNERGGDTSVGRRQLCKGCYITFKGSSERNAQLVSNLRRTLIDLSTKRLGVCSTLRQILYSLDICSDCIFSARVNLISMRMRGDLWNSNFVPMAVISTWVTQSLLFTSQLFICVLFRVLNSMIFIRELVYWPWCRQILLSQLTVSY